MKRRYKYCVERHKRGGGGGGGKWKMVREMCIEGVNGERKRERERFLRKRDD